MSGKTDAKPDPLPNLDDLLQCPVCYEIPSGHIFQCNEGHHVCEQCKKRLDVCPVCRALFFGTRNYAMEELIANVRKLRAFKLGGKVTTGPGSLEKEDIPVADAVSHELESNSTAVEEQQHPEFLNESILRLCQQTKGLFRCYCCTNANAERLPMARLLNHLRYFHAPDLIEGQSENREFIQVWQVPTNPDRITTALRVSHMGIFFLTINITATSIRAWLNMVAEHWVANKYSYTITLVGNDREVTFSNTVWSVKSCEGYLIKRGHCLLLEGLDAQPFITPASLITAKLVIRHPPRNLQNQQTQPRAVMRVASQGVERGAPYTSASVQMEPVFQDLQNDGNLQPSSNDHQENVVSAPLSRHAPRRRRQMRMTTLVEDETQPESDQSNQTLPVQDNINGRNRQNSSNLINQIILMNSLAVDQQNSVPSSSSNAQTGSNALPQNGSVVRVNKKNRRHRR